MPTLLREAVREDTERDLVERCQDGDADAFRRIFELYKDRVYSIALRYSGNASVAQDIAQETFLGLLSTIGSFRGDARFDSWLYRLVVNRCFDHRRRTRRLLPLVGEALGILRTPGGNALDHMLRTELSGHVRSVVENLPDEQRMIVVLRYTQGLSYEEIAEVLGCAPGTVGSRLNRVHKVLERRLRGRANGAGGYRV